MTSNILALFPGQGSQKVGMGQDFASTELGRHYFDLADRTLGFSLSTLCFNGPIEELTLTPIAQPAILTVSTICYETFWSKTGGKELPAVAAGHSLGEYSALVAARAISFEDGVDLVHKRGRYMQEAVGKGAGAMLAVLGKEVEEIEGSIAKTTSGVVEIANINAPGQVVVAGEAAAVNELRELMPGTKFVELAVSAPFHTTLMAPAREKLKGDLAAVTIKQPAFPVIANYSAEVVREPEKIRESLALQVCGRVRWVESMQNAVNNFHPNAAIEFGSGAVLSGMLKRIDSGISRKNADSVQNIEKLAA